MLNAISDKHYFSNTNIDNGLDELMVKIAEVDPQDTILDPTSGFKGAWLKILEENPHQTITIQEIAPDLLALAYLNARAAGADNFEIYQGDVLADPKYVSNKKLELFDKVITFPPISLNLNKEAIDQNKCNRFRFGTIGMRADYAFISNAIASLKDKGKAVIAVADGPLFQAGSTGKIRQNLVDDDLIEAVISLPDHMFIPAGVPINLLVINKDKHNFKGKIQFINGNQTDWYKHGRFVNALTSTGIEEITKIYTEKIEKDGISTIINNDDYKDTLSVKKYILPTEFTIDDQNAAVKRIELDFGGPTEFNGISPTPDIIEPSRIIYNTEAAIKDVKKSKQIRLYCQNLGTTNIQNIRLFLLTTLSTLCIGYTLKELGVFLIFIFGCFKSKWEKFSNRVSPSEGKKQPQNNSLTIKKKRKKR